MRIRQEVPADEPAIYTVHEAGFPTSAEAQLVNALRAGGKAVLSLVAERDGEIVGHVLFSPVTVKGQSCGGVGLAPIAVRQDVQRQGIGSALLRAGIEQCRQLGFALIVVLGEPGFYQRFGFVTASGLGLSNEYGVDQPFMALELIPQGIPAGGGLVRYAPEFTSVG